MRAAVRRADTQPTGSIPKLPVRDAARQFRHGHKLTVDSLEVCETCSDVMSGIDWRWSPSVARRCDRVRAWIVWATGLLAYIVAVLDRTTLGVSGLNAADRFAASPSVLSTFVVLQVVVYAGAQVPAGRAAGPLRLAGADRRGRGADGERASCCSR